MRLVRTMYLLLTFFVDDKSIQFIQMANFQMIQKVIIVALLITASLAGELTNNTSELQSPQQSINQTIKAIQQTASQINSSNIATDNTSILNKTSIQAPLQVQGQQRKEGDSVRDNNQTSSVQNPKEAQTVEINPKNISQTDQSANKTEEALLGNLTLQVLSKKVEQTVLTNPDLIIENKTVAETIKDNSTQGNSKSEELNTTTEVSNIISSTEQKAISLLSESILPVSTQTVLGNISDNETVISNNTSSQAQTLTTNNQTISQQEKPLNDSISQIQPQANSSIILDTATSNSSQSAVVNQQNNTKESEGLNISSNQVVKQGLITLSNIAEDNTANISSSNQTAAAEKAAITANESKSEQEKKPSIDSTDDAANKSNISEAASEQNETISNSSQKASGENISQLILQEVSQQPNNFSVINSQADIVSKNDTLNQTTPQKQQENDDNTTITNQTSQKEETVKSSTSLSTDNLSTNQTTSLDLSSNITQQPIIATDNQAATSQQKSQKQVKTVDQTQQNQSNKTEIVLFSGKLPDEEKIDPLESKKSEEERSVQIIQKKQQNNDDEIVNKFMLQTEVDGQKQSSNPNMIIHQDQVSQNSTKLQVNNTQGTSDAKNNTGNESESANITSAIQSNKTQSQEVAAVDNSSQILKESNTTSEVKNQSLIVSGQSIANETKIEKQATQVGQVQTENLTSPTADQSQTSTESKISVQNTTVTDTTTLHQQQNQQKSQITTPAIEDSANKTNNSLPQIASSDSEGAKQKLQNITETKNQTLAEEVKAINTSSITQNVTVTQTPVPSQKFQTISSEKLIITQDDPKQAVIKKQIQASKPNKNIEQNTLVVPKYQEKNKATKDTQKKPTIDTMLTQKQEKKEKQEGIHRQAKKSTKKTDQPETPSLNLFDFKQSQIKNEKEKEKEEIKQKFKNSLLNKKPFKLHAQQLGKQKAGKPEKEEISKEPRKIDQFNKQTNSVIEELARQKKALDKKLTSNKPKEIPILEQIKEKFIQEKKPKSETQTYVIAIFVIIGILVCHFLIKAFCGSKKKQAIRAQSAQGLNEEDEDFDLSSPDIAERLDEDY